MKKKNYSEAIQNNFLNYTTQLFEEDKQWTTQSSKKNYRNELDTSEKKKKLPGPDGFTTEYFQKFFHTLGHFTPGF